ncbi:MAG: hypothetical protein FWE59_06525 [Oscillospiraceae bacterium]|nr:hypothetical protein [Oscillospiraceae bacterium]
MRACTSASESLPLPPGCVWMQRIPLSRDAERRFRKAGSDTLSCSPTATVIIRAVRSI